MIINDYKISVLYIFVSETNICLEVDILVNLLKSKDM